MATARANVQQSSMAAVPILLGVAGCAVALWFRYPGLVALWLGITVAAFIEPPAVLTGPKVQGRPVPLDETEDARLEKFRFWSTLRTSMLPGMAWLPMWPLQFSWLIALFAGVVAFTFPATVPELEAKPVVWASADAIALFATIAGTRHAKRTVVMSPGTTIKDAIANPILAGIGAAVGAGLGVALAFYLLPRLGTIDQLIERGLILPAGPVLWVGVIGLCTVTGAGVAVRGKALAHWRVVYARRQEWTPRWRSIKQEPAPHLVDTQQVGPFTVDTFESRGSAADILKVGETKIAPTIGAGVKMGFLTSPNIKGGQPVAGTVHPNRFVIATCNSDQWPDANDPNLDDEVRLLVARTEWQPRWKSLKADPAPEVIDSQIVGPARIDTFMAPGNLGSGFFLPLTTKVAPFVGATSRAVVLPVWEDQMAHPVHFRIVQWSSLPDISDPHMDPELLMLLLDSQWVWSMERAKMGIPRTLEVQLLSGEDESALWGVDLDFPNGPGWKSLRRDGLAAMVAEALRSQALVNHVGGEEAMYLGNLDATDIPGPLRRKLDELSDEDRWSKVWTSALKQGQLPPTLQHGSVATKELNDGTLVHRYAFAPLQGRDPSEFFGLESKLATALVPAPFLTTTGWQASRSRPGDRHPQLFTIYHAERNVPSPTQLQPTPVEHGESAAKWVLRGVVNHAFKAARRTQPEVISVRCLTPKASRLNIWQVDVRLFGGDTLADIRSVREKLRQSSGVEWLRVAPHEYGVSLFMGAKPSEVRLANPRRDKPLIDDLDWTQAFIDAGVTSKAGGLLPTLVSSGTMPKNEDVSVLEFELPPGVAVSNVRDKTEQLKTAVGCEFLSPTAIKGKATGLQILAATKDPMPRAVDYDYDLVRESSAIPFGQGVDGEPVIYNWKDSVHLLVSGGTGSGKVIERSTIVQVPLSERFPEGVAQWGDLQVGDELYHPHGGTTKVTYLHEWLTHHPMYEMTLDDGQKLIVGANHLFEASTEASRKRHGLYDSRRREVFASRDQRQEWAKTAERIRELRDSCDQGVYDTAEAIEAMAGVPASTVFSLGIEDIAAPRVVPMGRPCRTYDAEAVWRLLTSRELSGTPLTIGGTPIPFGALGELNDLWAHSSGWLTARQMADILVGGRRATRPEMNGMHGILRRHGIDWRDDGEATTTIRAYPMREVLHRLWVKYDECARLGRNRREVQPLVTMHRVKDMYVQQRTSNVREVVNFALPLPVGFDGPEADLPIDPWLFGAWLGDGASAGSTLTVGAEDADWTVPVVSSVWPNAVATFTPTDKASGGYYTVRCVGLQKLLRRLGVFGNKHIPALYARASREQRLALLQGLMDTDGTIGANGSCELTFSNEQLATDVLSLIRGLGIKARMTTGPAGYRNSDGELVECKDRHRIHFTTAQPVFRMPRKAERLPREVRDTQRWLYITDIQPAGYGEGRCIEVDAPDGMHLVGDSIPTHNSASMQMLMTGALMRGAEMFVGDPMKGAADFKFAEQWCRAIAVTIADTAAMMRGVYAEVERRKNLNSKYGVGSYRDLPEEVRPPHVVVIIDEFTSLIEQDRSAGRTPLEDPELEAERLRVVAENQDRTAIGQFTGKIAREARSAGVTMWLGAQKLTSKALDAVPGGDSLKINMARLVLGVTTFGERMSALRLPEFAPDLGTDVPIGRGMYESSVASAVAVHTYWTQSSNLANFLSENHVPDAEPFDFSAYIRKSAEDDTPAIQTVDLDLFEGEDAEPVVDAGFTFADEDTDDEGDGGLDLSKLVVGWEPPAEPEATEPPSDNIFEPEPEDDDEALLADFANFDTPEPEPEADDWGFDDPEPEPATNNWGSDTW